MPLRLAAACLAALAASAARAEAACDVSADAVAFGVVDLTRDTTGTGRVVIDCTAATQLRVGITAGSGSQRRMIGPKGGQLAYDLFQDPGRGNRWGSGQGDGSAAAATVKAKVPKTLTVYGVVPRQTGVAPGTYADQLTVTLIF